MTQRFSVVWSTLQRVHGPAEGLVEPLYHRVVPAEVPSAGAFEFGEVGWRPKLCLHLLPVDFCRWKIVNLVLVVRLEEGNDVNAAQVAAIFARVSAE